MNAALKVPLPHLQVWLADAPGYRKQYGGKLLYRLAGLNAHFQVANELIAILFHCFVQKACNQHPHLF